MAWYSLVLAGLFEVVWAIGLKQSDGFTRFWPSVTTVFAMVISFSLLAYALRTLPLSTAYSVWVGIGSIGTVLVGIFFFHEIATPPRIVSILLIIGGIIGLKLTTPL